MYPSVDLSAEGETFGGPPPASVKQTLMPSAPVFYVSRPNIYNTIAYKQEHEEMYKTKKRKRFMRFGPRTPKTVGGQGGESVKNPLQDESSFHTRTHRYYYHRRYCVLSLSVPLSLSPLSSVSSDRLLRCTQVNKTENKQNCYTNNESALSMYNM